LSWFLSSSSSSIDRFFFCPKQLFAYFLRVFLCGGEKIFFLFFEQFEIQNFPQKKKKKKKKNFDNNNILLILII